VRLCVGVSVSGVLFSFGACVCVTCWSFYSASMAPSFLGRSGPNLEPGTMRVYVTNGPRNGLNIGRKVGPCPGSRRRWVFVVYMPFLKPFMPQTHTVPGFRLGPDLSNVTPSRDRCKKIVYDVSDALRRASLAQGGALYTQVCYIYICIYIYVYMYMYINICIDIDIDI